MKKKKKCRKKNRKRVDLFDIGQWDIGPGHDNSSRMSVKYKEKESRRR